MGYFFLRAKGVLYGHSGAVCEICKLNEKYFASCSDNNIFFWNMSTFAFESKLNEHKDWICYFLKINDDQFTSCSYDKLLKFGISIIIIASI